MGEPEEIASVALLFASDDLSFVQGAEITVDGEHVHHLLGHQITVKDRIVKESYIVII
ncbi:hypothetical protein [Paenibacillus sp. Soil750]|uniref:hypothetical protein n=1 Tax=Paenibacillus sp. Soil750 TaxID=1736398 RepID=UPI000A6E844A|nr:hypothetical protein [Paenibacillus sp. Soil750]